MNWSLHQQEIFRAVVESGDSLVIEAVAGSGKTTTILEAINHVPANQSVAFVAFNKSIADELGRRITSNNAKAMTLHSAGNSAWRRSLEWDCDLCKVDNYKVHAITKRLLGWKEYSRVGAENCRLVGLAKQVGIVPAGLIGYTGLVPDTDESWANLRDYYSVDEDLASVHMARTILEESILAGREVIDFDDMLYIPVIAGVEFQRYDVVFVDEAQDISGIQLEMISRMAGDGRVIAVGDKKQAIYQFRGAQSNSMDLIRDRFNARELPLSTTYRCAQAIVNHARQWCGQITASGDALWGYVGVEGTDWAGQAELAQGAPATYSEITRNNYPYWEGDKADDDGRARSDRGGAAVVGIADGPVTDPRREGITKWRGVGDFLPGDAILCRNTRPLVAVAFALIRKRVPCRILGRDIGQGLVALVKKYKYKPGLGSTVGEFLEWLEAYVEKECEKLASRKQIAAAGALRDKVETLQVFAEDVGIDRPVGELVAEIERMFGDRVEGMLTLATVHKSKGLEWDRVFVLDAGELMPSRWAQLDWEIEQERNLMYVAATRARRELRYVRSEELGI